MGDKDYTIIQVPTKNCGKLKIYVQGNLAEKHGKTVFLTVHDIGDSTKSWRDFVNHPTMADVRARSIFLHVCVPGQDENATDYTGEFPSLNDLGEDLVCVLDQEEIGMKFCIGLGVGAGANIICRFALAHPNRVLGVCLVHCTSTTAGVLEYIKDKKLNWQLKGSGMNKGAWEYLASHKFGTGQDEKNELVQNYLQGLQNRMNAGNLALYIESFTKRTDLSTTLAEKLKMDALLVVGSKASNLHTVYDMHQSMPRDRATLLVVDGVGDVLTEAPDRLTRALILFCKGCGALSGVSIPGMERLRTLSSSMEDADKPRKLSFANSPKLSFASGSIPQK